VQAVQQVDFESREQRLMRARGCAVPAPRKGGGGIADSRTCYRLQFGWKVSVAKGLCEWLSPSWRLNIVAIYFQCLSMIL
jgi:hypothetical protein